MKVPLSWLREYVEIELPVRELAHRLTMAGIEVSGIETIGGWEECYVGHVLEVRQHPHADRLTVCTVDIGAETLQVVCGAPNVAAGQRICFARTGARLFNVHSGRHEVLKAARIRGVVSRGMICSERELGIGEDHTGIVVLDADAPVGTPLNEYMGDVILDVEATTNRPDCLSVLGIAREVAALTGASVKEPDITYPEEGDPIGDSVAVEVLDPDLCPRYTASLVSGIRMGPSPRWMQDRLIRAGQRPINNVVDVTNYVMLEYGQPLHAFDYDAVGEQKIVVRRARENERLMTLDGVERHLTPDMLVIADAHDAIGLAGVMGGANSEMGDLTKTVLLESANFNSINNRRTAQSLKLRTEASLRFEKGLRPELAEIALKRATRLVLEVAGGTVARGIADAYPERERHVRPSAILTEGRLRQVLGTPVAMERAQGILGSLGFELQREGSGSVRAFIPYWRSDIEIEDDLVEEVARIVGYDNLPTEMLSTPIPHHTPQPLTEFRERVREMLAACGLQEVITYPLTSLESLRKAGVLDEGMRPLRMSNPLSPELEYMRTSLRASMLRTVAANLRHQEGPVRLFEVGRVYVPTEEALPEERETAIVALAGPRFPVSWATPGGKGDFYDAKGVVETLLGELRLQGSFDAAPEPGFHPGKAARIVVGDTAVGVVGEVHPLALEVFDLEDTPVVVLELDLEGLHRALPAKGPAIEPMARFPSAVRDLSILVDRGVPASRVLELILRHRLVSRATLFDVYEGDRLPSGQRSLAFHLHFQSPKRTLTADEITRAMKSIVDMLRKQVGASLRQ